MRYESKKCKVLLWAKQKLYAFTYNNNLQVGFRRDYRVD